MRIYQNMKNILWPIILINKVAMAIARHILFMKGFRSLLKAPPIRPNDNVRLPTRINIRPAPM